MRQSACICLYNNIGRYNAQIVSADKIIDILNVLLFRARQIYTKSAVNACIHEHIFVNLFGGYATPRKHAVFSRLALNSNQKMDT